MKNKRITILGLGYIGLPTAAILATNGYKVTGFDIDETVVDSLKKGEMHIAEPGLNTCLSKCFELKTFNATNIPQIGEIYIICVPTPLKKNKDLPVPNLDFVFNAVKSIASILKPGDLVILESTVPVGTTIGIQTILSQNGAPINDIHIAHCPERVIPGNIIVELVENDRIVGGLTKEATKIAAEFYRTFVTGSVIETDSKMAEFCKLSENSFRDVNIAFANELSILCEKEGIDVWELIKLSNRHPRVNIMQPGTGVGGHCVAVDPWFIVSRDKDNSRIVQSARKVNNYKKDWVVEKINEAIFKQHSLNSKKIKIGCLGIAFKPNVDDLRESPALDVVNLLLEQGHDLLISEPNISRHDNLTLTNLDDVLNESDLIIILVKHKEFMAQEIKMRIKSNIILDFCGALS